MQSLPVFVACVISVSAGAVEPGAAEKSAVDHGVAAQGPLAGLLEWPAPVSTTNDVASGPASADPAAAGQAAGAPDQPATGGQVWFGKRILVDTWGIISSPVDWDGRDWTIAGLAVGGTVAAGLLLDHKVQSDSQEDRTGLKDRWSGSWGQLGTFYSLGLLGLSGAYGWIGGDERGVNAMVDGAEATVIASGILCPALKYSIGRARPYQTQGDSDEFAPFSGNASFPSGHTTQAFTVASVLAFTFDEQPWVGGVSFALATGVGLSRINDNEHYASDVLFGAILGTWVGYEVVHYNRRRRGEEERRHHGISDVQVGMVLNPERPGLSFTWEW